MRDISLSTHNVVSPEVVAAELVVDEHDPVVGGGGDVGSLLPEEDVAALDVVVAEHDGGVNAGQEKPETRSFVILIEFSNFILDSLT